MKTNTVTIGNYKKLSTTLNNFNFQDIEFNDLTLLVGANGVGKTFILRLTWICNVMANSYLMQSKTLQEWQKYLDFIVKKSFDNCDFTGETKAVYDNMEVEFTMKDGDVIHLEVRILNPSINVQPSGIPVYMSAATRLFSNIKLYLQLRGMIGITDFIQITEQQMDSLTNSYKIFDIMFIEQMIKKYENPVQFGEDIKKNLKEIMSKDIISMWYDAGNKDFFITEDVKGTLKTYPVTRLSAGEQSWLNIMIQC